MRFFLLVGLSLTTLCGVAQDSKVLKSDSTDVYVCPPCGLSCDHLTFGQPGRCHVCNMQLIRLSEVESYDAGVFQSLKKQGVFYLIIFFGAFQGLILSMFLTFSKRAKKQKSNKYLALLVLSITLGCAYYLILEYRLIYQYPWLSFMPLKLFYLYGTTLYLYVATSLGHTIPKGKLLAHFSPALITITTGFLLLTFGVSPNEPLYGTYNLLVIDILGSAHAVCYFILSFNIARNYNKHIQHYVSDDQLKLTWLQNLLRFLVPFFTLWVLFLLYSFVDPGHLLNNYMFIFWIFAGVLIYWIGYRGFAQPELFVLPDKAVTWTNSAPQKNLNPYVQALENTMTDSKLYLNQVLTRRDVAEHLQITPNQLSYILNSLIGKSFYDYVNEFRVAEVMSKIEDPKYIHLTLEGIAYESGFNSKSTFNSIFKKVKGMTPKEYKNSRIGH